MRNEEVFKQRLRCAIEGDQLVIRIGFEALKMAAEYCPEFQTEDCGDGPWETVVDVAELAKDVKRALEDEEEDGTTPLHKLFDDAFVAARDDGSAGFADPDESSDLQREGAGV
jgi:hypothetical protein